MGVPTAMRLKKGNFERNVSQTRKDEAGWYPATSLESFRSRLRSPSNESTIVKLMYLSILTSYNVSPLPRIPSCAVVGNGPVNRSQSTIDQYDAVFRINDAPTRGFEAFVGSKTTHRILQNEYLDIRRVKQVSNVYKQHEHLLYIVHDEHDLYWLYLLLHCPACHTHNKPHFKSREEFDTYLDNDKTMTEVLAHLAMKPIESPLVNQSVYIIDRNLLQGLRS